MKVMVVEDKPEFRDLYREILISRGYNVVEAGNDAEAIKLGFEGIDLVSTDIRMPQPEDGYRLIQFLLDNKPQLPVVVLSDSFGSHPDLTEDQVKAKYTNVIATSSKATGVTELITKIANFFKYGE